jgi:hypothetical protein
MAGPSIDFAKFLPYVELRRTLQKHLERLEARVADVFGAQPTAAFFRQLPGAGTTLAPRLLVASGQQTLLLRKECASH